MRKWEACCNPCRYKPSSLPALISPASLRPTHRSDKSALSQYSGPFSVSFLVQGHGAVVRVHIQSHEKDKPFNDIQDWTNQFFSYEEWMM